MYEKTVSTALSSIYMFAVTALINLLMFGSAVRLAHDALLCLAGGIFVFGTDALFEAYCSAHYRPPKLLIIDTDSR